MTGTRIIKITLMMLAWYITSISAGIYNKAYLNLHRLPIFLTFAQSFVDLLCGIIFLGIFSKIQILKTIYETKMLALLGLVHFIGTILTNWSTLESAASFTHTIKAAEPILAVVLTFIITGSKPTPKASLYITITTLGIALTCLTEFDFQMVGFLTAMFSNVVFSSRSIFSKKVINLYLYLLNYKTNTLIIAFKRK